MILSICLQLGELEGMVKILHFNLCICHMKKRLGHDDMTSWWSNRTKVKGFGLWCGVAPLSLWQAVRDSRKAQRIWDHSILSLNTV